MFSGCWVHASQHNKHKHQRVNLNLSLIDCYCYYHPFKKVDCISNLICFPVKHLNAVFGSNERKESGREREWKDILSIVWHTIIQPRKESFGWVPRQNCFCTQESRKWKDSTILAAFTEMPSCFVCFYNTYSNFFYAIFYLLCRDIYVNLLTI
jgi:hypothetical protein